LNNSTLFTAGATLFVTVSSASDGCGFWLAPSHP